uniref:Uncharacterized protein n=1 Tax=uncultured marine virus TaxID=186617 RepID=A0A0F7L6N7_9VIRU|nr:hypothetical protein [uncultured marine virus]
MLVPPALSPAAGWLWLEGVILRPIDREGMRLAGAVGPSDREPVGVGAAKRLPSVGDAPDEVLANGILAPVGPQPFDDPGLRRRRSVGHCGLLSVAFATGVGCVPCTL